MTAGKARVSSFMMVIYRLILSVSEPGHTGSEGCFTETFKGDREVMSYTCVSVSVTSQNVSCEKDTTHTAVERRKMRRKQGYLPGKDPQQILNRGSSSRFKVQVVVFFIISAQQSKIVPVSRKI